MISYDGVGASASQPAATSAAVSPTTTDSKWITLVEDQDARVFTFGACMALMDLRGDGRYALVVGELNHTSGEIRLRALDGQSWRDTFKLTEFPAAVLAINLEPGDSGRRTVPAIAVAVGNLILVYKTMKPLCRYQLPPLPALKEEVDLWQAVRAKNIGILDLVGGLTVVRVSYPEAALTQRTRAFLLLPAEEREEFVREHCEKSLHRSTVITCMTTVNNKLKDEHSDQYLVIGTESRQIFIVDALSNMTKAQHDVPDVPVTIATHGTFLEKYRIFTSCRDGKIYTITKDYPEVVSIAPNDRPVTLLSTGKHLVVPCMDGILYFFKGKSHELQHKLDCPITCAEVIKYEATGLRAVAVALTNREVHIFRDDHLVDLFTCDEMVVAMKYGRFDREEGALALVLRNGTVIIKLIKRRAKFDPIVQEKPVKPLESLLPKKSALFLDHTVRERENCKRMNTAIFDNLTRMKYEINKRYADSLQLQTAGGTIRNDVILTPQLLGTGPCFKLIVTLQNTASDTPLIGYHIYLEMDQSMYALKGRLVEIPFVVPQGKFAFARPFRFIGSQIMQGEITIQLLKDGHCVPVLSVQTVIPESDPSL
ncbi:Bardet-Biedl syndrome 1 protein [Hypsibius exemplaris]|uniref:Bardet-Biedl syndrome 1 protein n=1 Tax=Hypsibius exemplaris TaxID=2072580 RepID=A0A1W0WQ41_HYPEX|nr:Bardet-Biedl syndrome 1 protein [Hypsibius exemplaris]